MNWNSEEIKKLRQRCGWSVAEMARHLGCRTDTVKSFEAGQEKPDPEVCHLFEDIFNRCEDNAHCTIATARADAELKICGLDQICNDDLLS